MNKPASKEQVKLVRSLLIELGTGQHRYLGSWCAKYSLTKWERRGAIDIMDSTVASKLIAGLQDEVATVKAQATILDQEKI
jgi:hypothetical protein